MISEIFFSTNLKGLKIAIIGSSPISLILAYILNDLGSKVSIFEKDKVLGGAWRTKDINNINLPESTHIVMPNKDAKKIFNYVNIIGEIWDNKPALFNDNFEHVGIFPPSNNKKYNGNSYEYSKNVDLISQINNKIKNSTSINLSSEVLSISEYNSEVILKLKFGAPKKFHYVFITPASRVEILKDDIKSFSEYDKHVNRSVIFKFENNHFGSSFIHFDGKTILREIQIFSNNSPFRGYGVAKLSRFIEDFDKDLIISCIAKYLSRMKNNSKVTIVDQNIYNNFRMTYKSQKNLLESYRRIRLPIEKSVLNNFDNKEYITLTQDLSRLLSCESFYKNISTLL